MVGTRTSNLLHRITNPLLICCLVTVGLCVHTALALPGSGTQQDPWRIKSLADFDEFAADPNYWSGFTRLETDVDLAGRTYSTAVIAPDVNNSNWEFDGMPFTGVFDGNDHKLINLTIDDSGAGNDFLGLFGYIGEDSQVRNLGIEGGSVSGRYCVGGLVGLNSGSVSNCYSTGDVSGTGWRVGGLVGGNYESVSNCYSTGDVSGDGSVGGLVGWNYGSVLNCYSTGDVNGVESVGGLVAANSGSVLNCYSTGEVNGGSYIGGLVAANSGSVLNCYSTGEVSGTEWDVGGLVGANWGGSISNCYSTGSVNGCYTVGGLVGYNDGSISNCYSTGEVSGTEWDVGGLVGANGGSISNCYSTGDVNGIDCVGGLVGVNGGPSLSGPPASGQIINSYSTGDVSGGDCVGGLVGYNFCGDIVRSFWDAQTSGEPNMCGGQNEEYATGCDPNCGKTTAQMQTKSTFTYAGWDFVEIWGIGEHQTYPYLRFAPAGDFNYDKKVDLFDLAILASHWLEEN